MLTDTALRNFKPSDRHQPARDSATDRGRPQNDPPPGTGPDRARAKFPHPGRRVSGSKFHPQSLCEPYRDFIEAQLRLRRNYTSIYQDLVDQFGFTGRYNSVKRFVGRIGGAPRSPGRYGLQGRQADHHEGPRRYSARAARQAERSCRPHRFPGLSTSGVDDRYGVRDRWRDRSHCLNG